MDTDSRLSIILIFVLLVMGAYFASCEIALSSVNRIRMRILAEKGSRSAGNVMYILDNFDRALSTMLIGNNLSHILSSSIATVTATRLWGTDSVAAVTLILTVIVFFFAELLPKNIAKKYCESFSRAIAGSLILIMRLCAPFSYLLTAAGDFAAGLFGKGDSVSEDEFYDMVENIAEDGSLEEGKGELVQSVINFGDLTVGDVLTSRLDLVAVDDSLPPVRITDIMKTARHSNLPVYRGSIDNVVGVVSCRKYIKEYLKKGENTVLSDIMDKPFFIHESVRVASLLPRMNRQKANIAVVLDDFGGVKGIVTAENAIEELVGDIWDEDDVVTQKFVKVDENTYDVSASMYTDECFELIGFEDDEEEDERRTMTSLVHSAFDVLPGEGDSFEYKGLKITVLRMRNQRILALRIKKEEAGAL